MTLIDSAAAGLRCPICGAPGYACGGPSTHTPVDWPGGQKEGSMADLVRIQTGPGRGIKLSRVQAEAYLQQHPEASIMELPTVSATEPEPEPSPAPEPEPTPPPSTPRRRSE